MPPDNVAYTCEENNYHINVTNYEHKMLLE